MRTLVNSALNKYHNMPIAAKAGIWFLFCSVLQKCMAMITTPLFTRMMTTEQYGQFTVYNTWLQVFTIFTTFRLNLAVFNKGMSKFKEDRDGYTATMQTITTLLTGIVFAFYLTFRKRINSITELPTYIMMGMFVELLFVPAIDFWTIKKRYEYIYVPVVIRTVLMAVANALLGVIAVLVSTEKGYARIYSCIFVNVTFGITLYVYNLKRSNTLFRFEYAKFAILFNLPLLLHYLSQYILDQFDHIMVQKMVGLEAAALYGVAYNIGSILKIITQSANQATVPWQYRKMEEGKFKDIDNTFFTVFVFLAVCTILFVAAAPELLLLFAGKQYFQAKYIIPPIALSVYFMFLYMTFANVEFYYNANKFTMFISMFGAGLNVILNYIGIRSFGYIAAAYTTMICYLIYVSAHYLYMTVSVQKKENAGTIFKTGRLVMLIIGTMLSIFGIAFLYNHLYLRYGIIATVMVVCVLEKGKIKMMLQSQFGKN